MSGYHYTESGLDTVYLVNGYEIVKTPQGKGLKIRNVDALHNAIGKLLVKQRRLLTGSEIRFLRTEMLMSQLTLSQMVGVKELTIHRWEKGKTEIPKAADASIRMLYVEYADGKNIQMTTLLREIADIEHERAQRMDFTETQGKWAA